MMSLHITYKDGSNPFCVIAQPNKVIDGHIKWQRKHCGDNIKEMFIVDDDGTVKYL